MNESGKWDQMLRQALASANEPEEKLNQSIINQAKERSRMNRTYKKKISAGLLVAVLMLVMSVTAYAATQLFSSNQVAEHLGEKALAKAFESKDAIQINQSKSSGGYNFTLHGIVTGAGLKEFEALTKRALYPNRTYAVVSIARQDGGLMPKTGDTEYGKDPFFVSPLIKGQKPWQVNIASMKGGYSEAVYEGIMYRLIECDDVEMFADKGVYLAISSGSPFFNKEAFAYNEQTGEISARADYQGASILFNLPLDTKKADPAKAEVYLQKLLNIPSGDAGTAGSSKSVKSSSELEHIKKMEDLKKKLAGGMVIPESEKEVTYNKDGRIHYQYGDWNVTLTVDNLFTEGQTGYSEAVHYSVSDKETKALQFHRDSKGVITGRVIIIK